MFYFGVFSFRFLIQLTLSQTTNFRLNELADVNFKFDENGRKFSKWVENTVRKGEIARYEQFLLFPQCFQQTCTYRHVRVIPFPNETADFA